jgi:hypothetical protein
MQDQISQINAALAYPDWSRAYFQGAMPVELREAMDKMLVASCHPLAFEAGTNENRFRKLHEAGYRFQQ